MQARKAARVLPLPVGAEISVLRWARIVRPAGNLRLGGRAEAREKPFAHDGMRPGEMVFR